MDRIKHKLLQALLLATFALAPFGVGTLSAATQDTSIQEQMEVQGIDNKEISWGVYVGPPGYYYRPYYYYKPYYYRWYYYHSYPRYYSW